MKVFIVLAWKGSWGNRMVEGIFSDVSVARGVADLCLDFADSAVVEAHTVDSVIDDDNDCGQRVVYEVP